MRAKTVKLNAANRNVLAALTVHEAAHMFQVYSRSAALPESQHEAFLDLFRAEDRKRAYDETLPEGLSLEVALTAWEGDGGLSEAEFRERLGYLEKHKRGHIQRLRTMVKAAPDKDAGGGVEASCGCVSRFVKFNLTVALVMGAFSMYRKYN
eukprot:TRINITY_DN28002_c0_g1_i1.p2 TRINITY_DN28002_c0_g1~~TRINITY_DN28002_c0_g1_i1.p2  ORF type:complete len:152 (-),score=50.56 TRINITY_DN28002_c0_g1_i1:31-486(-)